MQLKPKKLFLEKFVYEIIIKRALEIQQVIHVEKEDKRIKKEIEVQKLRSKYIDARPKEVMHVEMQKKQELIPSMMVPPKKKPIVQTPKKEPIKQIPEQIQKPAQRPIPTPIRPISTKQAETSPKPRFGLFRRKLIIQEPKEIDFGKIRVFIRDPTITQIECQGEDKNILIKKAGSITNTNLKLSKQEIDKIIKDFSEKARIPLIEGMLKARVKNLTITAVVSSLTTSKFIISKTFFPPLRMPSNLKNPNIPEQMPPLTPRPIPISGRR